MRSDRRNGRATRRTFGRGPRRGWFMVNPTPTPVRITARLVVKPKQVVFVPLALCLTALSQGMLFADKAKKGR